MGARTAAKLLARYGSLEGVLAAAAAGQLKGWGPAVQQFLAGSGNSKGGSSSSADGGISSQREALLRRNMRLFAANSDPSVVEPRGMQQLLAALERLGPAESAGAAAAEQRTWESSSCRPPELAWLQPMFARRWRHLLQLAADAAQSSSNNDAWLPGQQATPQGLAVDELRGPEADQAGSSGTAVFYVCPIDVAAGGWNKALSAASTAPQGGDLTAALMPLLSGPMRHHVRLVQRAGFRVELRLPPTVL